jgi:hypothetical protein
MKRRKFGVVSVSMAVAGAAEARRRSTTSPTTSPTPQVIDAVAELKALRITTGPLTNGYLVAPAGRLNWYFTHLGLLPIIQYLTAADLDTYIRKYLDLYLSRIEGNYIIQDVNFNDATMQNITLVPSDSDNSYASTLLMMVARYLKATNNWTWWDANKAKIKNIAYANIAMLVKSNGLARVFQMSSTSTVANYGYLMNNCEDYRGLREYAAILNLRGESTDANYYNNFATTIAQSINTILWDSGRSGFKMSDQDLRADPTTFYPGTTCQAFPEAFGVSESATYFTQAYNFLNTNSPSWPDCVYDPYPWAVLGYVAAKRGDSTRAKTQMAAIEKLFVNNRAMVTINELGFYQRMKSLINGYPDM